MNDTLEVLVGIVVFIILIWPVAGFIWVMRWIGRREKESLAELSSPEELRS